MVMVYIRSITAEYYSLLSIKKKIEWIWSEEISLIEEKLKNVPLRTRRALLVYKVYRRPYAKRALTQFCHMPEGP